MPSHFSEFERECKDAHWEYSSTPILDGRYTIGVGPYKCKTSDDGKWDYYAIDVEEPYKGSCTVIIELALPLNCISQDKLMSPAKDLVDFDPQTQIITYNLGKSVFKCKLVVNKAQ